MQGAENTCGRIFCVGWQATLQYPPQEFRLLRCRLVPVTPETKTDNAICVTVEISFYIQPILWLVVSHAFN